MDAKEIFTQWLIAKAHADGRPWKKVKNWDKVMKRKDWPIFERLAKQASRTMLLVDVADFFKANFEMRGGRFQSYQIFHQNSMQFYSRWKRLPTKKPDQELVIKSLMFITTFCKQNNISPFDYFNDRGIYPHFIRHIQNGKLHPWIFTYYVYKVNTFALQEIPKDVLEHAVGKDFNALDDQITIWWMQLLASQVHNLIEGFFERIVNGSN